MNPPTRVESLGPAETLLKALLAGSEHLYHGRPGMAVPTPGTRLGVRWVPCAVREEDGCRVVHPPRGKKGAPPAPPLGVLQGDGTVVGSNPGRFRPPGLFPEAARWWFDQVLTVYRLDPEFVARWGSWAIAQDHRDLRVVLAAFLLVQPRSGRPLLADGKPVRDPDGHPIVVEEDDREVGEAMVLLRRGLDPKMVARVGEFLALADVQAAIRAAGFTGGGRNPFLGRWPQAVTAWLRAREANPPLLASALKAGWRCTIIRLAQRVRYRPSGPGFARALRWKQVQHESGRRSVGIGEAVADAESWAALDERAVCERISAERPAWKRLVSLVPALTPAVAAAAVEAGCLSGKDLLIATPTLEALGLLTVPAIRARWEAACRAADDQRARHVARTVVDSTAKAALEAAADTAAARVAEKATRNLRVCVCVDISGSMQAALPTAKDVCRRLLAGLPTDRVRIAVFNTMGRELLVPPTVGRSGEPLPAHVGSAVLDALFGPLTAGGGTDHATGVRALAGGPPHDDDVIVLFVGDEGEPGTSRFVDALRQVPNLAGLAMVRVPGDRGNAVTWAAQQLGLPMSELSASDLPVDDPYRIPGVLRALLSAAPTRRVETAAPRRKSLVEEILATPRLTRPVTQAS
jgi:hypothetical protein